MKGVELGAFDYLLCKAGDGVLLLLYYRLCYRLCAETSTPPPKKNADVKEPRAMIVDEFVSLKS
jgi:hypothetical protein